MKRRFPLRVGRWRDATGHSRFCFRSALRRRNENKTLNNSLSRCDTVFNRSILRAARPPAWHLVRCLSPCADETKNRLGEFLG